MILLENVECHGFWFPEFYILSKIFQTLSIPDLNLLNQTVSYYILPGMFIHTLGITDFSCAVAGVLADLDPPPRIWTP